MPNTLDVIRLLASGNIRRGRHRYGSSFPLYFNSSPARPIARRDAARILAPHFPALKPRELQYAVISASFSAELPIIGHVAMSDEEATSQPFQTLGKATLPRWMSVLDFAAIRPHVATIDVKQWTDYRRPDLIDEGEKNARSLRRVLGLTASIRVATAVKALRLDDDLFKFGHGPALDGWIDHLCGARTHEGGVVLLSQPYLRDVDRRHFEGMIRSGGLFAAGSLFSPYYPRNASVVVLSDRPLPIVEAGAARAYAPGLRAAG